MKRFNHIDELLKKTVGRYSVLHYSITLNDDSDEEWNAYEVCVTNKTNDNKLFNVLRANDEGDIEIEKGEDFCLTNDLDFAMTLFLEQFLTLVEV